MKTLKPGDVVVIKSTISMFNNCIGVVDRYTEFMFGTYYIQVDDYKHSFFHFSSLTKIGTL